MAIVTSIVHGIIVTRHLAGAGSLTIPIANLPAQPAWNNLSFASGWTNYGATFIPCQYTKDIAGWVHVRGLAKRVSGSSSIIGTLPVGYRPSGNQGFSNMTDTGISNLQIAANGDVVLNSGGTGFVYLDNIDFYPN